MVNWPDPLTNMWNGPDPVLIQEKGSPCIFSQKDRVWWLSERLVRQVNTNPEPFSEYDSN